MHSRSLRRAAFPIALGAVLLPLQLFAQTPQTHATQYWLTAGAGVGYVGGSQAWKGQTGSATSLGLTVQHRMLVTSLAWARASDSPFAAWHVGALAGLGSSPRFPVRGSIAVGLGVAGGTDDGAHLTVPLELQLGTRLTPTLGLGVVGFAHFAGPTTNLGMTFGVQVGRLR